MATGGGGAAALAAALAATEGMEDTSTCFLAEGACAPARVKSVLTHLARCKKGWI